MSPTTPIEEPTSTEAEDFSTYSSATESRGLASLVAELRQYFGHFLAAKLDGVKLTAKRLVIYAVLGIIAAIVAGTILITASVLLLVGLAYAIGALFDPDEPFVGMLIVAGVVLLGTFGGGLLILKRMLGSSRKYTIDKYERMEREERAQFGRDAEHFTR